MRLSRSLWNPREARGLSGPGLCAYASRLIGADPALVLWGGGNSSVKTVERDHAGRRTPTLWVKASGFDMKTITADGFAALRLDDLRLLRSRESMTDEEMVAFQSRCLLDPKAPKPSIETLLHAFVPAAHVYHAHADAAAVLSCSPGSRERLRRVFGGGVLWVPYLRPGFALSKLVAAAVEDHPGAWALVLDKHGVLTWGEQAQEAYERLISLVRRASTAWDRRRRGRGPAMPDDRTEWRARLLPALSRPERRRLALALLPRLRGLLGRDKRVVLRWRDDAAVLDFLRHPESGRVCARGPYAPDHVLQVRARPLYWRPPGPGRGRPAAGGWSPPPAWEASLAAAVERYRAWHRRYFQEHSEESEGWDGGAPRVVLVPGVGLFAGGQDCRAANAAAEIALHNVHVQARVAARARYSPLDETRLGEVEFWPMETFKRRLAPPERELERRVVFITGAAGAIGSAAAERFCQAGAHVVLADLDLGRARVLEARLSGAYGAGAALAVRIDVGDPGSVREAFEEAVLAYGGVDVLFSNAGIAKSAPIERLGTADWEANLRVNATGHFLCAREALGLMRAQGTGGAIVVNASKNVLAPGREFAAYSASKAAAAQLARVAALEGGELGVRVNVVNPDAVFEGSGLWSPEVRRERARAQGIRVPELEGFYAGRTLLKARVGARDVAEAVLFLASDRAAKTTGAMLPVDGGLREAFPR